MKNTPLEIAKLQHVLRKRKSKQRVISWALALSAILVAGSVVFAFNDGRIVIPIGALFLLAILAYARNSGGEEIRDLEFYLHAERSPSGSVTGVTIGRGST